MITDRNQLHFQDFLEVGAEDDLLIRLKEKRQQLERRRYARRDEDREPADSAAERLGIDAVDDERREPRDRRVARRRQEPPGPPEAD
jgi:hypothetical protein